MTRGKRFVYAAVPALIVLSGLVGLYLLLGDRFFAPAQGRELNRLAWERSFLERNLPVPSSGPREGFWGERLSPKARDPITTWREEKSRIVGMLDIDERGFQTFVSGSPEKRHVLIVGGSVAFGAYASSVARSYFQQVGRSLEAGPTPADITVCAAGAWKSSQELLALATHIESLRPDVIVLFNGLNDLTSGATSAALFGERAPTPEGVEWSVHLHEHDYEQRVSDYLDNMRSAARLAAGHGSQMLFVLQPSLAERRSLTSLERHLLSASLEPHESKAALARSYEAMREGLRRLAREPGVEFLDLSHIFDHEKPTTFTDLWHFADPGHDLVAAELAARLVVILDRPARPTDSP